MNPERRGNAIELEYASKKKQILKKALERPENCFIGSTLVHTREGLCSIEDVKVGDDVLSRPEDESGETRYKRITQTFKSEDKEVWYVDFVSKSIYEKAVRRRLTYDITYRLIVTPNQPFRVRGLGWTRADELTAVGQLNSKLPEFDLANGEIAVLGGAGPIKKREGNPNQGWCLIQSGNEQGFTIDLSQGAQSAEFCEGIPNEFGGTLDRNVPMDWTLPENAYRYTVYDLEVEDDHTYFAGTCGVWVHNCLEYYIVGVGQNLNISA